MSCNCGNIRCGVQGSIRMNDDSCVSREEWHKFKANYETLPNKQNQLIAGDNITLFNNRDNTTTISAIVPTSDAYTKSETDTLLEDKQNKLTAGDGITIVEDPHTDTTVISSTGSNGPIEVTLTHNGQPTANGAQPITWDAGSYNYDDLKSNIANICFNYNNLILTPTWSWVDMLQSGENIVTILTSDYFGGEDNITAPKTVIVNIYLAEDKTGILEMSKEIMRRETKNISCPNGITNYSAGTAPIDGNEVFEAFHLIPGKQIILSDRTMSAESAEIVSYKSGVATAVGVDKTYRITMTGSKANNDAAWTVEEYPLQNMSNYYNKTEVDGLIAGIEGLEMEVVSVLPATGASNKIYLLEQPGGGYEQWVYTGGQWVDLGSASVDLSDYYTKTETDTLLDNKQDKLTAGQGITISGNNTISSDAVAYTAGDNITIESGNIISAVDTKYTAGVDIQITPNNVINYIGSGGTPTKAELLTILGMQELDVIIKDDQGVEQTATVIGTFGTPPTPPTPTGLVMDYDNFSQNTMSWPDIHTCNVYEFVASWGQYTPVPINNYGAEIQLTLTGITLGGAQLGDLTGTSTIDGGILMASTSSTYDSLYGDVYFSVVASNAAQDEITLVLHSSSGMEPTQPLNVDNINITVLDPGHN